MPHRIALTWGIKLGAALSLVGLSLSAGAASFNCDKAATKTEISICSSPRLGELDEELAATYREALTSAKNKEDLRKDQKRWIDTQRDACRDPDCLFSAYRARTAALRAEIRKQVPLAPVRGTGRVDWPFHPNNYIEIHLDSGKSYKFEPDSAAEQAFTKICAPPASSCSISGSAQGEWLTALSSVSVVGSPPSSAPPINRPTQSAQSADRANSAAANAASAKAKVEPAPSRSSDPPSKPIQATGNSLDWLEGLVRQGATLYGYAEGETSPSVVMWFSNGFLLFNADIEKKGVTFTGKAARFSGPYQNCVGMEEVDSIGKVYAWDAARWKNKDPYIRRLVCVSLTQRSLSGTAYIPKRPGEREISRKKVDLQLKPNDVFLLIESDADSSAQVYVGRLAQ